LLGLSRPEYFVVRALAEEERDDQRRLINRSLAHEGPYSADIVNALIAKGLIVEDLKMLSDVFAFFVRQKQYGGDTMTVEEQAKRVSLFLRSLQEHIITHSEFGRIYTEAGRLDQQVADLVTALDTNRQGLQEAKRESRRFPAVQAHRDRVTLQRQGLRYTIDEVDKLWREFREGALIQTESLISQVQAETRTKSQWDKVLGGLREFKEFLALASGIMQAWEKWSPHLAESVQSALDQLDSVPWPF
jgi:hypothetical protein